MPSQDKNRSKISRRIHRLKGNATTSKPCDRCHGTGQRDEFRDATTHIATPGICFSCQGTGIDLED